MCALRKLRFFRILAPTTKLIRCSTGTRPSSRNSTTSCKGFDSRRPTYNVTCRNSITRHSYGFGITRTRRLCGRRRRTVGPSWMRTSVSSSSRERSRRATTSAALVWYPRSSTRTLTRASPQDWSSLYKEIESTQSKIRRIEIDAAQVLIARVRSASFPSVLRLMLSRVFAFEQVLEHFDDLTATGDALAELDVALGFAEVAEELDWVKPEMDDRYDVSSPLSER